MPKKIQINHSEVTTATSRVRSEIMAETSNAESTYRQIQSSLRNLDGGANARLVDAAELSLQKTHVTASTLSKLALFMDLSARQVDEVERNIVSQLSQMEVSR